MRPKTSTLDAIFPWETLHALVGGSSALDISRLHLRGLQDAEDFLESYGFIWSDDGQRAEAQTFLDEAWALITEELFEGSGAPPPGPALRAERDVRRLLLAASTFETEDHQRWCCAVLRVMHVLAHSRAPLNERFSPLIRRQIMARFEPHLTQTDDGFTLGRGEEAIALTRFDVRASKSTRSIAMKLAHKPENVGTDVFDRLGVRFVTRRRFDSLLVVRYLRLNSVMMFANVKPSRSRNSLVDLDGLKAMIRGLDKELASGTRTLDEAYATVYEWTAAADPLPSGMDNQHSAIDYRSIQFTCRQLIRIDSPLGPLKFFFPFEIQVMDQRSFEATRSGRASHDDYKARQRRTVQRRILRDLIVDDSDAS
ncbi:MAG: hypothetical protein ACI9OJ_004498 [Myxococcota bacterium]|jgi:uncharacterized protein (TIGR04562 family)